MKKLPSPSACILTISNAFIDVFLLQIEQEPISTSVLLEVVSTQMFFVTDLGLATKQKESLLKLWKIV